MEKKQMVQLYQKSGKMSFTMKNDYLFKVVLQADKEVLAALIASLLHLKKEEILSVEVKNPIEPGEEITAKTFILDLNVLLNGDRIINLEMQNYYSKEWRERSLGYLCRSFDSLNKGEDYVDTKSAIHIGFLDFDLPDAEPEFYATYRLLNMKNHEEYSSKFTLSVVSLKHIELATDEDRAYGIDRWAQLFGATTWEELKMLAKSDEIMEKPSTLIIRYADEDERVRQRIQAREDIMNRERAERAQKERLMKELATKDATIAEKDATITEKDDIIAQLQAEIADLKKNQ